MELLERIKSGLYLFNTGSDNNEYLRGQLELSMFLLDSTSDELIAELAKVAE